jgi:hypothetical protein
LLKKKSRLFNINGVPVFATYDFWLLPILVTAVLTWVAGLRKPGRSWGKRFGIGLMGMPIALFAEIGHAMAHTVTARKASAPMDEILLSAGMPRTLYNNNGFPPKVHIMRSLGGPIFSFIGLTLSYLWRECSPRGSFSRELAEISLFGHSVISIGSLTPIPIVDGGTIYKWKLVENGKSVVQADQIIKKASFAFSGIVISIGVLVFLITGKRSLADLFPE